VHQTDRQGAAGGDEVAGGLGDGRQRRGVRHGPGADIHQCHDQGEFPALAEAEQHRPDHRAPGAAEGDPEQADRGQGGQSDGDGALAVHPGGEHRDEDGGDDADETEHGEDHAGPGGVHPPLPEHRRKPADHRVGDQGLQPHEHRQGDDPPVTAEGGERARRPVLPRRARAAGPGGGQDEQQHPDDRRDGPQGQCGVDPAESVPDRDGEAGGDAGAGTDQGGVQPRHHARPLRGVDPDEDRSEDVADRHPGPGDKGAEEDRLPGGQSADHAADGDEQQCSDRDGGRSPAGGEPARRGTEQAEADDRSRGEQREEHRPEAVGVGEVLLECGVAAEHEPERDGEDQDRRDRRDRRDGQDHRSPSVTL